MKKILIISLLVCGMFACKTTQNTSRSEADRSHNSIELNKISTQNVSADNAHKENGAAKIRPITMPAPPVYVYKTKADYSRLVPVILSDDHSRLVSYPDPTDVQSGNQPVTPVALSNGYWYDRRGIGPNVAFTKFTYEEYAGLKQAPAPAELLNNLVDTDPLTELWSCERTSPEKIDAMIISGEFQTKCKRVK